MYKSLLLTVTLCFAAIGDQTVYGLFIAGSDAQWWPSIQNMHDLLVQEHGADTANIFLLQANGFDPDVWFPAAEGTATAARCRAVFDTIAARMDDDDLFIFLADWHGNGYLGNVPGVNRCAAYHGYFGAAPRMAAPDDEERDFPESDAELSLLCATGGLQDGRDFHYGLEQWGYSWHPSHPLGTFIYRLRAYSHFDEIILDNGDTLSDTDSLIEVFIDFAAGDYNKDGVIDTAAGEVLDFDGDGNPAFTRETEMFDEDDWGAMDSCFDNYTRWHSRLPGHTFTVYDAKMDNRLDIDINPVGATLHANGTDIDNDGLIDGFDLNDDGDTIDQIAIDETMQLFDASIPDDTMAAWMATLTVGKKVFITNTCHGGGFIDDLSGPNTIIITGSTAYNGASASLMPGLLHEAFGIYADEADSNGDGRVSFWEAHNHACLHPHLGVGGGGDLFMYDDNGDGIGHLYPIPVSANEGAFGRTVFLSEPVAVAGGDSQFDVPADIELIVRGSAPVVLSRVSTLAQMRIFSPNGRLVVKERMNLRPGMRHVVGFHDGPLSSRGSGVYLCALETAWGTQTLRFTVR